MAHQDINFYETNWRDTVGYAAWHLDAIKDLTQVKSLIDIGAAHGDFIKMFRYIFGYVEVTAIEANKNDAYYLDTLGCNVIYKAVGKPGKQIFYTNPNDPVGGGSSLYLENTSFFSEPEKTEMEVVALDSLGLTADFIKIDIQGAEYDVLMHGQETIKNAKFLLLELSFLNYNLDAPLIDDVLDLARQLGFRMIDTFGPTKGGHLYNGRKNQVDVLLARKDLPVFMV